jgi:hypothetical protein
MLSRFERHQAASYGAAAVPSKTMCRQILTTPDGPERHRRFYLAVLISSRSVMSGIVDRGREGRLGSIDANDPRATFQPKAGIRYALVRRSADAGALARLRSRTICDVPAAKHAIS